MRTIYFPLERENPEILNYLLDTVLHQNGTVTFQTSKATIEVSLIVAATDDGWGYDPTYLARLMTKPENMRYCRAKYIGITTTDLDQVKDFVLSYVEEAGEKIRFHKKKTIRPYTPEVIPEEL